MKQIGQKIEEVGCAQILRDLRGSKQSTQLFEPQKLTKPIKKHTFRSHFGSLSGGYTFEHCLRMFIWMFPKIGVPPNHPFK